MALTIDNQFGAKGIYLMDGTHTSLVSKNIIALYVQEDSTFTTLTDEDDAKTTFLIPCSLAATSILKVPDIFTM